MSKIKRPFYNLHQLKTGLFTSGGEFVLKSGEIYVGSYHETPGNQRFSGFQPEKGSVEIFELRLNPTPEILIYNRITGNEINRYSTPSSYSPIPSLDDYSRGKIERFFIQKRNSTLNSIMEIDQVQFTSINVKNNPGINGVIWNKLRIDWIISKIPLNDASYLNGLTISKNSVEFPHLETFLTNNLEFYK